MISLKDLLMEGAIMDMAMANELATELKKLNIPYKDVSVSSLGGIDRPSVIMRMSFDYQKDWANNILHNSRYAMLSFGHDGVIELFSKHYSLPGFRKSRFKTPKDAIVKLKKYIDMVNKG